MKKIIVLLFLLFFISGCSKEVVDTNVTEDSVEEVPIVEEEKYTDDNNTKIGLYLYRNNRYNLVSEYKTYINTSYDIVVLQIYPSNEEIIEEYNYINKLYNDWTSLDNFTNLKIGFNIKYTLSDGKDISYNILDPETATHYDIGHIYCYLYNDYKHRFDSWYSHIEQDEYNSEGGLFTSIKLYAADTDSISSKITLTVFTYDGEDDFDDNGNYRGNSSYSLSICDINKTCD